ncbi:type III restriction protein res subunit [Olavius sp. associated proteobacterium Delta 1]|nr:type III restriction protein res subunit [Olavius sp. associated proteobacterium Delta 1]
MATFTITIANNLRLKNVPPDLLSILIEKLELLNPKWLENERMGRWNRGTPQVLRFYDKVGPAGLWIPRGFMRQLILLCRKHNVQYQIDDQRRNLASVNFDFAGTLRSFQQVAVDRMLTKDFGTLNSATGSGKTIMALYMIARRRQPALIVVHTKDLAAQWTQRIESFLSIGAGKVGLIGGGKKVLGEKITIALVQSLYKCVEEVAGQIGFLVVDECHRCPSRTFTEAVTGFDSNYMLGLSATPWRRDKLSKLIFWHLGDVHHEVDKKHLIQTGDVLPAEVIVRETSFKPYYDPVNEYSKMLSELTADTDRNVLIAGDVAGESVGKAGICLVLSDRKAHCENLRALLKFRFKVDAELLTGDLSMDERQTVIERLNQNKAKVVIATGQLIGEGFDCRDLSTLFLATPIRFSGRVLQYLGRVLRPAPGKKMARVFDYVDVHVDTLNKAARARQKVYRR